MTILTWNIDSDKNEYHNKNYFYKNTIIVLLLVFIVVELFYFFNIINSPSVTFLTTNSSEYLSEIKTFEMNGLHALNKHGVISVDSALKCLSKYGTSKTFKTFGFRNKSAQPRTTFLCFDIENNQWYGIVTTGFKNNVTTIVTIYDVAQKTFPTIEKYIEYLKNDWGAVEINYILNAGKYFVKPAQ